MLCTRRVYMVSGVFILVFQCLIISEVWKGDEGRHVVSSRKLAYVGANDYRMDDEQLSFERTKNDNSLFMLMRVPSRRKRSINGTQNSNATSEPEPEGENKPEPEGETEPKPEGEQEPEPEGETWPEPVPEWSAAKEALSWAWQLHVYGFAVCYVLIAIHCIGQIIGMLIERRQAKVLKTMFNCALSIFSLTRAIALLADPYGSEGKLDPLTGHLLWSIGHPCLISAFSILLLVLIDTTNLNLGPPKFQRFSAVFSVACLHVILALSADFVVYYTTNGKALLLVCQIYFLLVSSLLAFGYFTVGRKIRSNTAANVHRDSKLQKLQMIINGSCLISIGIIIIQIYGAVSVFGVYSDETVVAPWSWWSFQTCFRTLELLMCLMIVLISINTNQSTQSLLLELCIPCLLSKTRVHPISATLNTYDTNDGMVSRNDSSVVVKR